MNASTDKAKLRAEWNKLRDQLIASQASASKEVREHCSRDPHFTSAQQIALYAARPFEIEVALLWNARPGRCFFPRMNPQTKALEFYGVPKLEELKTNAIGIREPSPQTNFLAGPWKKGDLVLVPGLAFDLQGNRLGSGWGYYDRFLASLPPGVLVWGIAYDQQISTPPLPRDPWDIVMQKIVTPAGFIQCSPPAGN